MKDYIPGYAILTVKEIKRWTEKVFIFKYRYDKVMEVVKIKDAERLAKQGWLKRFFQDGLMEVTEYMNIYKTYMPKYLRGAILIDWHKRLRGLDDNSTILINIDDAQMLEQIASKLEQPFELLDGKKEG